MTDVVIVGSGPTGLMAAALLVRSGVSVRVLDKSEQQAHESRAFAVHAKSMELFLSIGLADQFIERGLIAIGAQIYVDGKLAAEINLDDVGRNDTPYNFVIMVPQCEIESILIDDLKRLGVEVEHSVEATNFTQSADGVVVSAKRNTGEEFDIPCQYLIGADGAHSMVRKRLGLSFEGAPYPQSFLLADCKIDWPIEYGRLKIFLRGRKLAIYFPLRGKEYGRLIVIQEEEKPASGAAAEASAGEPLELEDIQSAIRETAGMDVKLSEPKWLSRYRVHHRGVDKYGMGRVFVAGDAAHIHSPAGGQGMNTGVQDAANLAWKIAIAVKGKAPAALLDTYHSERWPIGQKLLAYTDRLFGYMTSQSGWVTSLRNLLIPAITGVVSKSGVVRSRAFHYLSQLGIRYHESQFVHDQFFHDTPRSWREGLEAGRRAPNGLFARNHDVFSLTNGYRITVIAMSRTPIDRSQIDNLASALAELPTNIGLELQSHIIAHSLIGRDPRIHLPESGQAFEVYGIRHETPTGLFLIRPDGYIAFRSPRLDVAPLAEFIRRFQWASASTG